MSGLQMIITQPKNRNIAILLALGGVIIPGLHKFYLGQFRWGWLYFIPGLLFAKFPIAMLARVASVCDALIYLSQGEDRFNAVFNPDWPVNLANTSESNTQQVEALAAALHKLEHLRQDGLITEYEFEQQRRQLLL